MAGVSISINGLSRSFPGTGMVLAPLDLAIASGEFVAILGPSGSGKSTLLRLIAGLEQQSQGSITGVAGGGTPGFVFQDPTLLPWLDVQENVMLPLKIAGVAKEHARTQALAALNKVGLGASLHLKPLSLSGGMRMRVSVARALVQVPRLLLLDEPFAALDEETRHQLQDQLLDLWHAEGMTIIFVTHSVAEACYLADRVLVFSARPAKLLADHRIERNSGAALSKPSRLATEELRQSRSRSSLEYVNAMSVVYQCMQGGRGPA